MAGIGVENGEPGDEVKKSGKNHYWSSDGQQQQEAYGKV
jgi:hypothetical protein